MQTPNLPIQVNSAGPAPKTARAKSQESDGGQFSAALSREMDQHKSPMLPPAAAPVQPKSAAPAKAPQQAAKPAEKAPAAKPSDKTAASESAPTSDAAGEPADAVKTDSTRAAELPSPVADMLALVASFNQPGAPIVATAPAAADPLLDARRPGPALPPDAAATQLPLTLKGANEAQPVAPVPVAPELHAETPAAQAFTSMLASASLPDTLKPAAQPAPDAALPATPFERAPLQAGAERAAALAPDQLKNAEPAQMGGLRARDAAAELPLNAEFKVSAPVTAPLQQAALSVAQAVNAAGADKIPARVGTPAWDNQVAQKIVWMVGGAEQSATLTLNPPDLGPMQVVLSVTNDMASVMFSSGQAEVRQALEDALPKLREMMSENGIELGNATVNDGPPEQQDGGRQANNGGGNGRGGDGAEGGTASGADGTNGSAAAAQAKNDARPVRPGEVRGAVDTFA